MLKIIVLYVAFTKTSSNLSVTREITPRKNVETNLGKMSEENSFLQNLCIWIISGGSTVPAPGSKERTSFVSVTDVSSDEELMRDIENI